MPVNSDRVLRRAPAHPAWHSWYPEVLARQLEWIFNFRVADTTPRALEQTLGVCYRECVGSYPAETLRNVYTKITGKGWHYAGNLKKPAPSGLRRRMFWSPLEEEGDEGGPCLRMYEHGVLDRAGFFVVHRADLTLEGLQQETAPK